MVLGGLLLSGCGGATFKAQSRQLPPAENVLERTKDRRCSEVRREDSSVVIGHAWRNCFYEALEVEDGNWCSYRDLETTYAAGSPTVIRNTTDAFCVKRKKGK